MHKRWVSVRIVEETSERIENRRKGDGSVGEIVGLIQDFLRE
ncbi:MAG: hypothetical protein AAF810_11705 [Cyanobacteria bacterium P01_D01_bin.36]